MARCRIVRLQHAPSGDGRAVDEQRFKASVVDEPLDVPQVRRRRRNVSVQRGGAVRGNLQIVRLRENGADVPELSTADVLSDPSGDVIFENLDPTDPEFAQAALECQDIIADL
jgi:hypothetical protein